MSNKEESVVFSGNPQVSEEYLLSKGFTKNEKGQFLKATMTQYVLELHDYQPEVGQAVVIKLHDRVVFHGYYHDTTDFESEFRVD